MLVICVFSLFLLIIMARVLLILMISVKQLWLRCFFLLPFCFLFRFPFDLYYILSYA